MVDDRVVMVSAEGYKGLIGTENNKGLHWTCEVQDELPIKMKSSGPGSERPYTMCQMFVNAVKAGGDRPSMYYEREDKRHSLTWTDYERSVMKFAKALNHLGVTEKSAVAIMGFNSPEWAFSCLGAMMNNCVFTGIYITNAADACLYQTVHSEAEVVCVETAEHLKRFMVNLDKMPKVKAFVVWGEKSLPPECTGSRFYLWSDFLEIGKGIKDTAIHERMTKQKPGECCCLIYTSGTTGNPKGCMLSHDNLTWNTGAVQAVNAVECPEAVGPENRIVSYLPLSHIAGLAFDILTHLFNVSELFFARPDALQGTLVETLKWAKPTAFFAVPRVWEKFEERLKEIAASKPGFLQSISNWAKGYGTAHVNAMLEKTDPPFLYSVANFLILSTIKQQLGLD